MQSILLLVSSLTLLRMSWPSSSQTFSAIIFASMCLVVSLSTPSFLSSNTSQDTIIISTSSSEPLFRRVVWAMAQITTIYPVEVMSTSHRAFFNCKQGGKYNQSYRVTLIDQGAFCAVDASLHLLIRKDLSCHVLYSFIQPQKEDWTLKNLPLQQTSSRHSPRKLHIGCYWWLELHDMKIDVKIV